MSDPQLIKHIRVVNRNIGDYQVSKEKQLKHVFANIAGFRNRSRRPTRDPGLFKTWTDQEFLDTVEVDTFLMSKRANNKSLHSSSPASGAFPDC
jgi:hypothetical protein